MAWHGVLRGERTEGQRCGKVRRFGRGQTRERLSGGFCFPANFVFLEGPVSGRMEFSPFWGRGRRRVEHVQVASGSHPLLLPFAGNNPPHEFGRGKKLVLGKERRVTPRAWCARGAEHADSVRGPARFVRGREPGPSHPPSPNEVSLSQMCKHL